MAPTATSDRECKSVQTCQSYEYQTIAPTATSDRVCQLKSYCANTEYISFPGNATADRECSQITDCAVGEYAYIKYTSSRDNLCLPCSDYNETDFSNSTDLVAEYEYGNMTVRYNLACQSVINNEACNEAAESIGLTSCAELGGIAGAMAGLLALGGVVFFVKKKKKWKKQKGELVQDKNVLQEMQEVEMEFVNPIMLNTESQKSQFELEQARQTAQNQEEQLRRMKEELRVYKEASQRQMVESNSPASRVKPARKKEFQGLPDP